MHINIPGDILQNPNSHTKLESHRIPYNNTLATCYEILVTANNTTTTA